MSDHGDVVELFLEEKDIIHKPEEGHEYEKNGFYDTMTVLNYFNDRSTNANAEAFNSKVKNFRAALRGVSDVSFFLFRLQKIYA